MVNYFEKSIGIQIGIENPQLQFQSHNQYLTQFESDIIQQQKNGQIDIEKFEAIEGMLDLFMHLLHKFALKKVIPTGKEQLVNKEFKWMGQIQNFVTKIFIRLKFSQHIFLTALILLDKVYMHCPGSIVTVVNFYPLVIASLLLGLKFQSEQQVQFNKVFAEESKIKLSTINKIEAEFLMRVGYSVFISAETFALYYQKIKGYRGHW